MHREVMPLRPIVVVAVIAVAVLAMVPAAQAGYVEVFGGPTYDADTQTGFTDNVIPITPGSCVNNTGTAVGYAEKYVGGSPLGPRAVRWDGGGTAATELGHLGTYANGYTEVLAYAVSNTNTAVGWAHKHDGGSNLGTRAVRWDAGDTPATELGNLGTDSLGRTYAYVYAVNEADTAVGSVRKYVDGSGLGRRAVRWDGGGTAATELGHLGTDEDGDTYAYAYAVNDANTAVGCANKYVDGSYLSRLAVRWDGGDTAATELGHLGTDAMGWTQSCAYAVNDSNTAVGFAVKHVSGDALGDRAVRWDGGGAAATELDHLGTRADGYTYTFAHAVNDADTTVGYAGKYDGANWLGDRAVRWDAGGTAATELGNLGTSPSGTTLAYAYAVSNTNTVVGVARKYVGEIDLGERAVMWGPDGVAVDLNTLIDPNSGWTLDSAYAISEDGLWIAGCGLFDPDGAGPLAGQERLWVMQVPEPASLGMLALGGLAMLRRRRSA